MLVSSYNAVWTCLCYFLKIMCSKYALSWFKHCDNCRYWSIVLQLLANLQVDTSVPLKSWLSTYMSAWCYNPENKLPHFHHYENLKFNCGNSSLKFCVIHCNKLSLFQFFSSSIVWRWLWSLLIFRYSQRKKSGTVTQKPLQAIHCLQILISSGLGNILLRIFMYR